ncbi:MAG: 3'-5' exonuclease [Pseudomonadota bacterium]
MKFTWPWQKKEQHPFLVKNKDWFRNFDQDRPIETYEFVSFDTELTGMNPRHDQIVSIGAVRIRNLRIVVGENFSTYVHPTRPLPKDSTLIHRISPEQVRDAPRIEEVLLPFLEFCGDALLLGHYVAMDMSFINRVAKERLGGTIHNPGVDTMKLAQASVEYERKKHFGISQPAVSYNLTALSKRYNLPIFAKHDALEDALQTAYLFLYLVRELQLVGCVTLKDFFQVGRLVPRVF